MVRRRLRMRILLIMPLVLSLCCGCSSTGTSNSSTSTFQDINMIPDTSTTTEPTNELEFERLFVPSSMKEEEIPVRVHIMTSKDSPLPDVIAEISEENQIKLNTIDYSRDFVLFVFMGHQNVRGPKKEVTQIWKSNGIIYIQANFHKQTDPTIIPGFTYPKEAIKVSKDNMLQFGEITLILLDQDGKERARTVCNIPE